MKKRLIVLFAIIIFYNIPSQAQRSFEFGVLAGTSNYIGDLSPDIKLNRTHFATGLNLTYSFNNYISLGAHVNLGKVEGNDADFEHLSHRNLNFYSNITEFGLISEFSFRQFGRTPKDKKFTPYMFYGFTLFNFDPYSTYNGEEVRLKDFRTEGQGVTTNAPDNYNVLAVSIPMGLGLKFSLGRAWNLRVHSGFRYTNTDYLDDVSGVYPDFDELTAANGQIASLLSDRSGEVDGIQKFESGMQRGDNFNRDWYIFSGVTLSYVFQQSQCFNFGRFRIPIFY